MDPLTDPRRIHVEKAFHRDSLVLKIQRQPLSDWSGAGNDHAMLTDSWEIVQMVRPHPTSRVAPIARILPGQPLR